MYQCLFSLFLFFLLYHGCIVLKLWMYECLCMYVRVCDCWVMPISTVFWQHYCPCSQNICTLLCTYWALVAQSFIINNTNWICFQFFSLLFVYQPMPFMHICLYKREGYCGALWVEREQIFCHLLDFCRQFIVFEQIIQMRWSFLSLSLAASWNDIYGSGRCFRCLSRY